MECSMCFFQKKGLTASKLARGNVGIGIGGIGVLPQKERKVVSPIPNILLGVCW